jgi:hypothetical protein
MLALEMNVNYLEISTKYSSKEDIENIFVELINEN